MGADASVLNWLNTHHADLVRDLADLVAIPSISTDGEHQKEIEQTAELTCEQMRRAGLQNVAILRTRRFQPLRLRRMARRARQADGLPLCSSRRAADQFRRGVAIAALDADTARRPAVRPRRRRRQGRHHRAARRHRRLAENARQAARQRQDGRRRRRGNRLAEPAGLLPRAPETPAIRCHRRLRHGKPRHGIAEHHLRAARHRGRARSRSRAAAFRSTAAWPAAPWPTRRWPSMSSCRACTGATARCRFRTFTTRFVR